MTNLQKFLVTIIMQKLKSQIRCIFQLKWFIYSFFKIKLKTSVFLKKIFVILRKILITDKLKLLKAKK